MDRLETVEMVWSLEESTRLLLATSSTRVEKEGEDAPGEGCRRSGERKWPAEV